MLLYKCINIKNPINRILNKHLDIHMNIKQFSIAQYAITSLNHTQNGQFLLKSAYGIPNKVHMCPVEAVCFVQLY